MNEGATKKSILPEELKYTTTVALEKAVDNLAKARSLLTPPNALCRDAYAKDADGMATSVHGEAAVSFCAAGALMRVASAWRELDLPLECHLLAAGCGFAFDGGSIYKWADNTLHEDVLSAFDNAVALGEAELSGR
jgi:hypothetical protein